MRRAVLLLVLLVIGWLGVGVVIAGPAAAHATLVSTDPGEGARLDTAPAEVTLRFSEGVSLGAGYARVLSADQERVDAGAASVDGGTLTIPLRGDLPDGGYLVTYRVISADSHPVAGAFSFAVGDAELLAAGAGADGDASDPVVAALLPAARWAGFAGLALAVGLPVLAACCWPAGWASPRLRRLAEGGAVAV
ncbi:copper resistance CopC family protein, partial [Blastococcus saxobsidens]